MFKNWGRFIRHKAVKVLGNGLKPVFSLHHQLFPRKRFRIPDVSPARRPQPARGPIPHVIWQTNYSNQVTLSVYTNYLFNRWLTPEFEHRYASDEACDAFVRENFPGAIHEAYARLNVGAARADFWRVLVLLKHGGIYLDIDSNFVRPPTDYLGADTTEVFLRVGDDEITNYFIAAAPGHPLLARIADAVRVNIDEGTLTSVYTMTGPTVVDRIVRCSPGSRVEDYRGICTQGQFTNKRLQYAGKKDGAWWTEQKVNGILKQREPAASTGEPGAPNPVQSVPKP